MAVELIVMAVIILAVIVVFKILKAGIKLIVSVLVNLILGGLLLLAFNLIPSVNLEINFLNAILTGIFGVPAVIVLLIIQLVNK